MRIALSLGLVALFLTASMAGADDKDKPKYTTKEVMKLAHGKDKGMPSLLTKITDGKGTDEDKKKILELYEALAKNPTKGDAADWKKLNDAIITAAKDVVDGKEGSVAVLKKAAACGACHNGHKGK